MLRVFAVFVAVLCLAETATAGPAQRIGQRFGLRRYLTGSQSVAIDARHDVVAVRIVGDRDGSAAAAGAVVEAALRKLPGDVHVAQAWTVVAERKAGGGLVAVSFSVNVDAATLSALAALVDEAGGHLWPVLTRPGTGTENRAFADDRLVVTAAAGQLDQVLPGILGKTDGVVVAVSKYVDDTAVIAVGAAFDHDAVAASAALQGTPLVISAEPNLFRELATKETVNDPLFPLQWHLERNAAQNVPGEGTISAGAAWDINKGDPDIVVAVFDSGTDWQHPDLVDNVRAELMFDASDDGDVDASPQCQGAQDGLAESPLCPGNAPFRESHGTAVSGAAVARGDNNIGLSGVCPLCSLAPVRLLGEATQDALTIAESFTRGCDPTGDRTGQGAAVINNSWGPGFSNFFPLSQSERTAFDLCRDVGRAGKGTVILFATGNDRSNVAGDAYAKHPSIIGVAASTNLDDWANYSNYGDEVDVAAPSLGGTVQEDNFGIVTSDVRGNEGYSINGSGVDGTDIDVDYTDSFSGTSAASPVAAGLAGLILSANPDLTAEQVRLVMTSTADKIRADKIDWLAVFGQDLEVLFDYDETGHSIAFGYGRINAARAVALAADSVALATDLGVAGQRCNPTTPAPGQCANCSENGFCLNECASQDECADGSVCDAGLCTLPYIAPTEFLEICNADCEFCVTSLTTEFQPESVCSQECTTDDDCDPRCDPGEDCQTDRFDCRALSNEVGGTSICAQGSPNSGGPADFGACDFNIFTGTRVIVLSDEGKELCGEVCFSDGGETRPGDCPWGFHCGQAECECTRQGGGGGCREFTCREGVDNIGVEFCVPNAGHADVCETDLDCQTGDFCSDGTCAFDDRAGCTICQECQEDSDCGSGRTTCLAGVCTVACDDGEACPAGSTCRDVSFEVFQGRFAQVAACLGDGGDADDVETEPAAACGDFTCRVPECTATRACDGDDICIDGSCIPVVDTTGPPKGDLQLAGGGCGGCTSTGGGSSALALVLLGLFRRRRR